MESGQKPRKKTKHYSRLIKKNSVARLKSGEVTIGELCLELNIDRHVVRYWCKNEDRWNDLDGSVTLRKHYPDALKRRFVREVEAGELTLKEACVKYDVQWEANTKVWFQKFGSANLQGNTIISVNKVRSIGLNQIDTPDITQETALKGKLRDAHLKIALLETMIDVAEKQLNIDIRKKAGAKQ